MHFLLPVFMKLLKVFAVIILFLSGCASVSVPVKLGITESEWMNISKDKKQILFSNYEQSIKERNQFIKNKKDYVGSVFLEIAIHSGQVMMPPFDYWQDYKPVKFIIFKDQYRDIILQSPIDKKSFVELGVYFYENKLYLDPSRYDLAKKNGSISINFSPLWPSGFSYKGINSSGYVRLNNVTIEIISKNAEERT